MEDNTYCVYKHTCNESSGSRILTTYPKYVIMRLTQERRTKYDLG